MHLLPHLAQLSPADINRPPSLFVIQRPGLGTLTWQMPAAMKSPVAFAGFKVQAEIHQALYLFLSALIMSAGNRKQALRVSSVLHELSDIVNNP